MRIEGDRILLSASDLTRASACEWDVLTSMDAQLGRRPRVPRAADAMLERTAQLGDQHEERILERLREAGRVVEISRELRSPGREQSVARTRTALDGRSASIYQAAFESDDFFGYADFVELVDGAYVVSDAKLARRAKVAALLQLGLYARELRRLGAPVADEVRLLLGDGMVSTHRLRDIEPVLEERWRRLTAIVRERRSSNEALLWGADGASACGSCDACTEQIDASGDIFQVAGIRRQQRDRLRSAGIRTLDDLVRASGAPTGMQDSTFGVLQRQARLQVRSRGRAAPVHELIDSGAISELSTPSDGDLFFDFEGDPLWQDGDVWGLDYLFGVRDAQGRFTAFWAHSLAEEKQALLDFLAFVRERRERHPDLRIYHYAAYERTHLGALAARHGVGEEEVDDLLRANVLVDLYPVVKRALAIGSPSYSLKKLEPLYMREVREGVANAGDSIVEFQKATELRRLSRHREAQAVLDDIEQYNAYDVESTHALRDWLLRLVPERSPRVQIELAELEEVAERRAAREQLVDRLLARAGDDPTLRDPDQTALTLAAAAVGFHRREHKSYWWEHFSRLKSPMDDWREQRDVITVDEVLQVTDWTPSPRAMKRTIRFRGSAAPGSRTAESSSGRYAVYLPPHPPAKTPATTWLAARKAESLTEIDGVFELLESAGVAPEVLWDELPLALAPAAPPAADSVEEAIARWARSLADAVEGDGPLTHALPADPALDVLRRRAPAFLATAAGSTGEAIVASLRDNRAPFVAVQGPPGTGKTHTGAHTIAALVRAGWRVGVVAQSHATVEHMLDKLVSPGFDLPADRVAKTPKGGDTSSKAWTVSKDPLTAIGADGGVVGGTVWTFAGIANKQGRALDLLVVDEAGQFSLANTIAAATSARHLLLIGDPQQLPQVTQGTHPAPVDQSALGWLCDGAAVLPERYGYFLERSWRMHPDLCAAVSDLAYDGKLFAHESERRLDGIAPGLVPVAVSHVGNSTQSEEEADAVVALAQALIGRPWHDGKGTVRPLDAGDLIVVAPYNAQVELLRRRLAAAGLRDAPVGTVDRFQGQERAVALLSLAASDAAEVPRGVDFLLSINRLNVAISRGQWIGYLVHSPRLREHLPSTPDGLAQLSAFLRLIGHL